MSNVIAFQGEAGANSHIACLEVHPDWTPLPCPTFEDAFAAVKEGQARLANDSDREFRPPGVSRISIICCPNPGCTSPANIFLPVHHQLMAVKGATLGTVKTVQSHVQALGQCRRTLRKLGLTPIIGADTAGSARMIAEAGDPARAAIAPRLAADVYGLEILAADIEDESHNTTRFIILAVEPVEIAAGTTDCVTSFIFRVRNIPAALYKAMGGFATNGVKHDQTRKLHDRGSFHRHAILCGGRRSQRRTACTPRA